MKSSVTKTAALAIINLASHIPFLFAGYGREEDAWAQALNAKVIYNTGIYEVSRLPGHPLYELLLALLWPLNHTYFFYNLLTTLASTAAVMFFYRICRKLHTPHPFLLSLSLSFIPVFFISGTYTIDYNFALLFILFSFDQLIRNRLLLSGILIGIACGFRISSLFLLLPWLMMMKNSSNLRNIMLLCFPAGITAFIAYLPPLLTYGTGFMDFHKPPYPPWERVVYKLTFGIWGTILLLYLGITIFVQLVWRNMSKWKFPRIRNFRTGVVLILVLQLLVFFRLPFKSEFLIPALPFFLILMSRILSDIQLKILPVATILSCFLVGFDYKSTERGSPPSALHLTFEAGGKNIFLDFLQGPVIIDHRKRLTKYHFVSDVIEWVDDQREPVYLVCGWYYPQLMMRGNFNNMVKLDYLAEKENLLMAYKQGYKIYYLPEINEATAQVRGHSLTDSLGYPISFE